MPTEQKQTVSTAMRLVKFDVSDGLKTYCCMEYESLKKIKQFIEGIILVIKAPVEVRRGVLLLKNDNVEVIYSPDPPQI